MNSYVLLLTLLVSTHCCMAGELELRAKKIQYATQKESLTRDFLAAMSAEMDLLSNSMKLNEFAKLRTHRGRIMLGLDSPEKLLSDSSIQLSPEFHTATKLYVAESKKLTDDLRELYESELKGLIGGSNIPRAEELREETIAFSQGRYSPTPFEFLRKKPYDAVRIVSEKRMLSPLFSTTIPDELELEHHERRFRIHGQCRHDYYKIAGKQCGHFGKMIILDTGNSRNLKMTGFLLMSTLSREGQYAIAYSKGSSYERVCSLQDLKMNTIYEWSIERKEGNFLIEIFEDGNVVRSETFPRISGASFGFYATVRYRNTSSDMIVAFDY
ncbi:MAG: hypothetical protein KDA78_10590 [Planctomycetaceae bacterium]|nr:hypothetical protein [Planctomycetaceae bacterium]